MKVIIQIPAETIGKQLTKWDDESAWDFKPNDRLRQCQPYSETREQVLCKSHLIMNKRPYTTLDTNKTIRVTLPP